METIQVVGSGQYFFTIEHLYYLKGGKALDFCIRNKKDYFAKCLHRVWLPDGTTPEKWLLALAKGEFCDDAEGRSVHIGIMSIDFDSQAEISSELMHCYYGIEGWQVRDAITDAFEPEEQPEPAPRLTIGGKTYELREVGDE